MRLRLAMMAVALALAVTPAHAEWSGEGELGGVLARGNTETETLNARLDLGYERNRWRHQAGFSILRGVNDGVVSANRWELRGESDYELSERSFLFGALRHENDELSGLDQRTTVSAGYGRKLIDTEDTKLDARIGAGYRRSESRLTGAASEAAILRGAVDFSRRLTPTTRIVNRLLVESGSDNTFTQNKLSIEVKMNSALALGLSFEVRHNTNVEPGTERTDQVLTANLVFGF